MIEITDDRKGGIAICQFAGRLDGATSEKAGEHLKNLAEQDSADLVLDLSNLDYISSAGLRILLMAAKRAKSNSSKLVLAAPQESVMQVLEISGFTSIFEIHPTPREALEAVGGQ